VASGCPFECSTFFGHRQTRVSCSHQPIVPDSFPEKWPVARSFWLASFRTSLFCHQSTQLHEWYQYTAVAIMLGNVKVVWTENWNCLNWR
jgi:hypothetical protein